MEVMSPRSLGEALRCKATAPSAVPLAGGTDLLVELNFDRRRPDAVLNLAEVRELRGWTRENGSLRLGAGITYTELLAQPLASELSALAEAARTVGSPQIRNLGTLGGNLATASPAGDSIPPLVVLGACVELASARGVRRLPLEEFLVGPRRTALAPDELIAAVIVEPRSAAQTFMKVGPRNAMAISVVSLALAADRDRDELRASFGSASPVPPLVTGRVSERGDFAERVVRAAAPIDDIRGSAAYRLHALRVLVERALDRCLT
jgi:CO/xanthine dehydrogenase FAD-binding subunit